MKSLELAGPRSQTTAGTAAKTIKNSQGVFQNWLMSEAGSKEPSSQGKGTLTDDQLLKDACKKISGWLKATPANQDKQKADLLQTLSKLTGKHLDESAQQILQSLLQTVELKLADETDQLHMGQLLAEKIISEDKTALTAKNSAGDAATDELKSDREQGVQENEASAEVDKALIYIQMLISQLLEGNKMTDRDNQAHTVYKNGDEFLSALEKRAYLNSLFRILNSRYLQKMSQVQSFIRCQSQS